MGWKLTKDMADDLCNHMAQGKSLRSWSAVDGRPSAAKICAWLAMPEHAWFKEQYTRAREAQADAIFDECLDIADRAERDLVDDGTGVKRLDAEHVQRARLMIDTRKWMAGKLRPKVYGEKVETTHELGDTFSTVVREIVDAGTKD